MGTNNCKTMTIVDELYYNKGSSSWYRKDKTEREFDSSFERDGGNIVIRQKFPGAIDNVKVETTVTLTPDDIAKIQKLICVS